MIRTSIFITLIILLTLPPSAMTFASKSIQSSDYRSIFEKAFAISINKTKSSPAYSLAKKGRTVTFQFDNDPPTLPTPSPDIPVVEPIRYSMGQFKVVRSYLDFNPLEPAEEPEFKIEIVCKGGIAIPVYDLRQTPENSIISLNQSVSCSGELDGHWQRYFIAGEIIFGRISLFDGAEPQSMKAFSAHFHTEPYSQGVDENLSRHFDYSTASTRNLNLDNLTLSSSLNSIVSICVEPIESELPTDPLEPIEPIDPKPLPELPSKISAFKNKNAGDDDSDSDTGNCSDHPASRDSVSFILELKD